jgi:two-component system cell cycle response regulator DivK
MLVLLVEDHEDTRDAMLMYLKVHGMTVESAVTGLQAISMAIRLLPDVVVMDLGLPGMDGWEAARSLKGDARTSHIPIVALSAHALVADEERAREVGCAAFLRKPCLPSNLMETLDLFKPNR